MMIRRAVEPLLLLALAAAGGCSTTKLVDPMAFNREASEATDPKRVGTLVPGSPEEKQAILRFQDFFSVFSEPNIRKKIRDVYAADVYFNDTLRSIRGVGPLEEYMIRGALGTESCTVDYADTLSKDGEYFFRWTMHIRFKKFSKGTMHDSIGISHIRFNKDGKVVFHQDYWDAASYFFEKVPVVGAGIRFIRRRL